ncbi:MAG TPA: stalk domain-containing protein [Bacillota bacterium]|nr:stalk domain-containing protein [Bacillota bacterium]
MKQKLFRMISIFGALCSLGVGQPVYAQNIISFPVLSDIHVMDGNDDFQQKSRTSFQRALQDIDNMNPKADALIINGDLGDGLPHDYAALDTLLKGSPHPTKTFFTIGNHEFYSAFYAPDATWNPDGFPNGETEQASIQRFLQFAGRNKVYGDTWINDFHFLFLGSEQFEQSDRSNDNDAYLSKEQLKWLKEKLQEKAVPGRPIFVFLHQPLPNTVAGTSLPYYRGVIQHQELKDILSSHPEVILFSGHTHWKLGLPHSIVRNGFTMVNSSSEFEPYDTNDQPIPSDSSEGLLINVLTDKVEIKGRDFVNKKWISETSIARLDQNKRNVSVRIKGKPVSFSDAAPYVDTSKNRTMIPLSELSNPLQLNVKWDAQNQTAKFTKSGKEVVLKIGEKQATINGEKVDLDLPVSTEMDRIYVPLYFICQAFEIKDKWDAANNEVVIS